MTNKYLEKVAELDNGKVGYLATGVGAAVGGTIIGQKAGGPISRAVHEKPSIDKHTIKKLLRQIRI